MLDGDRPPARARRRASAFRQAIGRSGPALRIWVTALGVLTAAMVARPRRRCSPLA
jgi:hypothetical protein